MAIAIYIILSAVWFVVLGSVFGSDPRAWMSAPHFWPTLALCFISGALSRIHTKYLSRKDSPHD